MWHLWTGFIELFTGHWKAAANSFELDTAARTLQINVKYNSFLRIIYFTFNLNRLISLSKAQLSVFKRIDSETECNFITFVRSKNLIFELVCYKKRKHVNSSR